MANTTHPCDSLKQFADFFTTSNTTSNITSLVQACPQQCNLAWGTGNPDLSGIGVFISYIFQFGVCLLLGPGYIVLHQCLDKRDAARRHLSSVHVVALATTSLFASPIAVASIVHLKRHPALFEVTFIYYLAVMQFLGGLSLVVSLGIKSSDEEKEKRKTDSRGLFTSTLGFAIHVGVFGGVLHWIGKASLKSDSIEEFISACKASGNAVPVPPVEHLFWDRHLNKHLAGFLGVVIIAATPLLGWLLWNAGKAAGKRFLPPWLATRNAGFTTISVGLATGMAYCFAKMHLARLQLARLAQDGFADNEWGFGQIVALFVWVPLIVEVLLPLLLAVAAIATGVFVWSRRKVGSIRRSEQAEMSAKSRATGNASAEGV
ncbi:hypothetical protein BDW02DRAFT_570236 [Decorospora gaudefroyi]|uniref:Uncharacterized protein n=1 Tax=Decorospora gaudefroyi TaxID=184978 RepID=A0A6A5KIJ4_9PLEO|nr:hypothetical protein BDW02DRAFT_570236 [Decorospora gaudefroyi]